MPENKIIKPEFKMDLSLFTRIMPGFVIGERVICLSGIESITYELPNIEPVSTEPEQLAITYSSGITEYFNQDEERELEAQIKAGIEKSEQQMNQMQMLAAENQALKQEIARLMAQGVKTGSIVPPWGKNRH